MDCSLITHSIGGSYEGFDWKWEGEYGLRNFQSLERAEWGEVWFLGQRKTGEANWGIILIAREM